MSVYLPAPGAPLTEAPTTMPRLDGSETGTLHPDLRAAIHPGPLGDMLGHPLLQSIICAPPKYALLNAQYAHKRRMVEEALDSGHFRQAVFAHERPWRVEALDGLADRITDDTAYWKLVGDVWCDTENAWQNTDAWDRLLGSPRPGRSSMMNATERKALGDLGEKVPVFRGIDADTGDPEGRSWTLERNTALWFARRSEPVRPLLVSGIIARADILALLLRRDESEVLVVPGAVNVESQDRP